MHLASRYCTLAEVGVIYAYGVSQLGFDAAGVPTFLSQVRAFVDKRKDVGKIINIKIGN